MFLIDAPTGVTPIDRTFADLVRKAGRPVVLVAKQERRAGASGRRLLTGMRSAQGEPVAISAEHGEGLADLLDALRAALPELAATRLPIAMVGAVEQKNLRRRKERLRASARSGSQ